MDTIFISIIAISIFCFLNNLVDRCTNSKGYQPSLGEEIDEKDIIPPTGGTGEI